MKSRRRTILAVTAVLMVGVAMTAGSAIESAQAEAPPIWLKAGSFKPTIGEGPPIPPGLMTAAYAQNQRGHYIVQFRGAVEQSWKNELTALGAEILDYIPDFAFKVRMNPGQAKKAEGLTDVAWVGIFHPGYKLGPDLARNGTNLFLVRVERGAEYGLTIAAIATTGAQLLSQEDDLLVVAADSGQVDAIARILEVDWVENFRMRQKHNDYAAGVIMGANTANAAHANGLKYDGSTQVIGLADTGLGGGTAATAHPDVPASRIVSILNRPGSAGSCFQSISNDGAVDVDSGHGTHTTVSAVGDGDANGIGKGTAPNAKLVFQAVENWVTISAICKWLYGYADGYYLTGLPSDLNQLYQEAYTAGARIHSNSWGGAAAGAYTVDSKNTDNFVWNHKDTVITFSAGNSGVDANNDGIVDSGSMAAPATAKNVIAVGASENAKPGYPCDKNLLGCSGGANDVGTYGGWWPTSYPTGTLSGDTIAGNADHMAAFSSRGPTADGRIKPDVVAPGTWILSGYSDLYQPTYDASPNPKNNQYQWGGWGYAFSALYKYMGGTSMSNPLLAGGAAVVRDYYKKAHNIDASAALVKATIINSAVDMKDEDNQGTPDNTFPIPNNHEGWGRVNLAAATSGSIRFDDNLAGAATNGTVTYTVTATGGVVPLKVSLVWSDYPSSETASVNLVNDLNLSVTGSEGTFRGNSFSGGWSVPGGSADTRNNVECVYIQRPAGATYMIEVKGFNVPNGPQPFALVVDGATALSGPSQPPPPQTLNMHVGDLDGAKTLNNRNWKATVTVTVHNASHNPLAGVTVSGTWSGAYTGSGTCTTGSGGTCTVPTGNMSNKQTTVTFMVTNLTKVSYSYQPPNHDPDGDSNGTAITIDR